MKMNFFKLFATAAVIAGTIGGTSIAFAEKSGGILKFITEAHLQVGPYMKRPQARLSYLT